MPPVPSHEYDQTTELQQWLDTEPSSWPAGDYRVDGTLYVHASISAPDVVVRRVGPAARMPGKWSPRTAAHVRIDGDEVTVEGLRVVGTNPSPSFVADFEAQHGFVVNGTFGSRLVGCTAEHVYGDWVYAGSQGERWTVALEVLGGGGRVIGRQGIGIAALHRGLISGVVLADVARTGVDIEPPNRYGGCLDLTVSGSTFARCTNRNVGNGNGLGQVGRLVVAGNDFDTKFAVQVSPPETGNRRFDVTVVDNVSHGTSPSLRFQNIDGFTFTGNTITWQPKRLDGIQGLETCTDRLVHQAAPAGMPDYHIED